tara:strand:- start:54 stop:344 length:291 start_codon:yes stop_codon:yes gene_type:complete
MAELSEISRDPLFDTWIGKIPGRLTAEQAAGILGFASHDMPTLVKHKLLIPLGQPTQRSTKYFAAVEVFRCAADTKWLSRATKVASGNWRVKLKNK